MIDQEGAFGWKKKRAVGDPRAIRFLTFSCVGRLPLFHRAETKSRFLAALLQAGREGRLVVHAWVVMPEHVHLLLAPGAAGGPLPAEVARLKARFAAATLRLWERERPGAVRRLTQPGGTRRFWQPGGGHDRWMRSLDDCAEKVGYIHGNPVRRGLVERATEYRWSSAWGGTGPGQ